MPIKLIFSLAALSIFILGVGAIQFVFAETGDDNIVFFLDKTWYNPRDSIEIEGWINTVNSTDVRIEIINPNNLLIYHDKILLQDTQEIEHSIHTFGTEWNDAGFYQIRISYEGETQAKLFPFGSFNTKEFEPKVILDKEVYSWTDTVKIMIISPNDNTNSHRIDKIKINIFTRAGTLSSYMLEETGFSDGVFSGIVTLSGHPDYDIDGDGRENDTQGFTNGAGPEQGKLSAHPNDLLKVSFSTPSYEETLETFATVQFQVAKVEWSKNSIYPDQKALARVIDPDVGLQPEIIDKVKVLVILFPHYSKEFTLEETEENSGVFEREILFVSTSSKEGILVKPGSKVSLKYEDKTLPIAYLGKSLEIIANATVKGTLEPEEIVEIEKEIPPWIKNTLGKWSKDSFGDDGFFTSIQYLVDNEMIKPHTTPKNEPIKAPFVPSWVKNSAGWWAQGLISDKEFVKAIQHLVDKEIIII